MRRVEEDGAGVIRGQLFKWENHVCVCVGPKMGRRAVATVRH